jgi:hypothetical protein
VRPSVCTQLLGDAGLADASLAGDQHNLALPAKRLVEGGTQAYSLGVPADEPHPVRMLGTLRYERWRGGEIRMDQREDMLRPGQPLQLVRSDVDQPGPGR